MNVALSASKSGKVIVRIKQVNRQSVLDKCVSTRGTRRVFVYLEFDTNNTENTFLFQASTCNLNAVQTLNEWHFKSQSVLCSKRQVRQSVSYNFNCLSTLSFQLASQIAFTFATAALETLVAQTILT